MLLLVAAGATYSVVSVVASFAEIKAVGEQVTEAAQARAQRSRAEEPAILREAEPARELDSGRADTFESLDGLDANDPLDPPEAGFEPSTQETFDNVDAFDDVELTDEEIETSEDELRYIERSRPSDNIPPPESADGVEIDDAESSFDEAGDDGAGALVDDAADDIVDDVADDAEPQ